MHATTDLPSSSWRRQVGTVVSVPANTDNAGANADTTYGVSFNNGRSVYYFDVLDLVLDPPNYNYEVGACIPGSQLAAVTSRMQWRAFGCALC